jgi:hypothetical protein
VGVTPESEGSPSALELSAASLRATGGDLKTFVPVLAEKLDAALPGRVRIERRRTGLLSGTKTVSRVECALGERHYKLELTDGAWAASRSTVVRGIALKSELLEIEPWLEGLLADLGEQARANEELSVALGRLLG